MLSALTAQKQKARIETNWELTLGMGEAVKCDNLFLSPDDKAGDFSVVTDDGSNTTLLKHSKPIAWFSRTVSRETVKVFVELVKYFERKHEGPSLS